MKIDVDVSAATAKLAALQAQITDANGTAVPDLGPTDDPALRAFMAGRVPAADCPHYIAKSEADAGFTRCERC